MQLQSVVPSLFSLLHKEPRLCSFEHQDSGFFSDPSAVSPFLVAIVEHGCPALFTNRSTEIDSDIPPVLLQDKHIIACRRHELGNYRHYRVPKSTNKWVKQMKC
jgi:hypothetical protein